MAVRAFVLELPLSALLSALAMYAMNVVPDWQPRVAAWGALGKLVRGVLAFEWSQFVRLRRECVQLPFPASRRLVTVMLLFSSFIIPPDVGSLVAATGTITRVALATGLDKRRLTLLV